MLLPLMHLDYLRRFFSIHSAVDRREDLAQGRVRSHRAPGRRGVNWGRGFGFVWRWVLLSSLKTSQALIDTAKNKHILVLNVLL